MEAVSVWANKSWLTFRTHSPAHHFLVGGYSGPKWLGDQKPQQSGSGSSRRLQSLSSDPEDAAILSLYLEGTGASPSPLPIVGEQAQ